MFSLWFLSFFSLLFEVLSLLFEGGPLFAGLSDLFSYVFGVLAHFSLGLIITGVFVITAAGPNQQNPD